GEKLEKDDEKRPRTRILPGTIIDSIRYFKSSEFVGKILGEDVKERYLERKLAVANRSAKELGVSIKNAEVLYHHEITNQVLWNKF
ncbi:MAG: Glutamine synthetase, partial [candidate division WS6 bacterium GW2011_GWA2_37_6]